MSFYEQYSDVVINSLSQVGEKTVGFIPNIVGAIFILLIGWLVARAVQAGLSHFFKLIGVNKLAEKTNIDMALRKAHIKKTISEIIARIFFWIIFLIFFTSAFSTLGLDVVARSVDQLLFYIPNVIAAILIILIGALIANFTRDFVITACHSANVAYGKVLGKAAKFVLMVFVVVIAINQIGINTALFTTNITLIVAAVLFTLVLAVGLGGRSLAANMIASHYVSDMFKVGDKVTIAGVTGKIKSISSVAVVIDGGPKIGKMVVPTKEFLNQAGCCR